MDNSNFANATLDDIVFEGRNREYGAYMLRKIYNKHLIRGLVISTILFALFLSMPLISSALFPEEEIETIERIVDVNTLENPPPLDEQAPPPPPPPPVEPPPPPVQQTIKFTPPVVKEVVKKVEEIPDQEKLKEVAVDVKTQAGDPNAKPDLSGLEGGTGKSEVAPAVEEIFTIVEQSPQFPGGEAAMFKYLSENIKYPAIAQKNGLEGLVVVSFVVNRKGEISDIQVLKPMGGGLSEEAVRVIKGMPKWSPGKQNGREVSVRYNLPVRFSIR